MAEERFHYTPLNTARNEFRLLYPVTKADSAATEDESSIIAVPDLTLDFQLRSISLDESPKYTALSYVWGDDISANPIQVNRKTFTVTKNLHEALRHLQHQDIAPAIWIDAICINQADKSEKSFQLSKMRQIYSSATNVVIWLGPEVEHSNVVADFLCEFPESLQKHFNVADLELDDLIDVVSSFKQWNDFSDFVGSILRSIPGNVGGWNGSEFVLEAVDLLCRMKWWSRVWIVQEFVLAAKCHFQVGLRRIDAASLPLLIVGYISNLILPNVLGLSPKQITKTVAKRGRPPDYDWLMYLMVCRERGMSKDFTLYNLLCQIYCRPTSVQQENLLGATDRRDYIYGLYALVSDNFKALGIEIDYGKAWQDLFIEVAYMLIRAGHLDVLALCQWTSHDRELPRWTPNWHRRIAYPNAWFKTGSGSTKELGYSLFSAASAKKVHCELLPREYNEQGQLCIFLKMRGVHVDEVHEVKSAHPRSTAPGVRQSDRLAIYGTLFRDVEYMCRRSKALGSATYPSSVLRTAAWKMLVWDHELNPTAAELQRSTSLTFSRFIKCQPLFKASEACLWARTHATNFKMATHRLIRSYHRLCGQWYKLKSSWNFFIFQNDAVSWIGGQWNWIRALPRWLWGTSPIDPLMELDGSLDKETSAFLLYMELGTSIRPFVTTSGFVGIGPGDTEPGDVVCLFDGGRVPYVLRRRQDLNRGYSFQGCAYVHGIMDGEFLGEHREPIDFELL